MNETTLTKAEAYAHYTPSAHTETDYQLRTIEQIQDTYSYHARHFCAWVRAEGRGINFEAVHDYLAELNRSDYSAGTKRVKRQAVIKRVRQLFRDRPTEDRVKLEEALKDLNTGETRAPKVNSTAIGADKYLSPTALQKLIEGARSDRQRLFIRFLAATGCRISEALNIKILHCTPEGEKTRMRVTGKGSKERYIAVPIALYEAIRLCFRGTTWIFETGNGKPYTRSYVSGQIAKLGRAVLNRRISAHSLRHTFATLMIRRGVMIDALSRYLGHSSVSITLDLYCHNSLSDDELFSYIAEVAA